MNEYNSDKKYESFKIPDRRQVYEGGDLRSLPQVNTNSSVSQDEELFYVIDYDSSDMKGVGKFVLKSQKIDPPKRDEIRDLFHSMRDIARATRTQHYDTNRFYDRRAQQENSKIFYKQGIFMKDFTDSFHENTQFSSYFPNYQMMSYEQLRTYFTWRTKVRKGEVTDTSLSYAFLYIYELLGNIGVDNPQDGLNKLMSFWKEFRIHNSTIDKYVLRWLKDYHIFYELPQSFQEFVELNHLEKHYPKMMDNDTDNNFDLYCAISKYDIRNSAFFTGDNVKLITDGFNFVTNKLREIFMSYSIRYDDFIFHPTKRMSVWQPFRDALFHQWVKQPDRRVVLSENEVYICNHNNWASGTVATLEDGRLLIGYIMKQIESVLRVATKYKYKLTANSSMLPQAVVEKLNKVGLSLEKIVSDSVMEFYREATKTVVVVDHKMLSKIRLEALATQEKLIVPEQKENNISIPAPLNLSATMPQNMPSNPEILPGSNILPESDISLKRDILPVSDMPPMQDMLPMSDILPVPDVPPMPDMLPAPDIPLIPDVYPKPNMLPEPDMPLMLNIPSITEQVNESATMSTPWERLKNALSSTELQALQVLISEEKEIKKFADNNGIMLEVLIDGINEKAMDFVGDNLLDEEFNIYDDYKDQVKEMVE